MENYTKFSQNLDNNEEVKVEVVLDETVDIEPAEVIGEIVNEAPVEETVVEVETVVGVVSGCAKLNLREEANVNSKALKVLDEGVELVVSPEESTEDFYKVVTDNGVEGYCMKKFITIK